MQKWIAIRAGAVVAMAGSAATLLLSVAMAAALLFAPMRNSGPFPPNLMKAVGCVMAALFAGAGTWGICAGVGVFRRRNWARISMVVFAGLLAFFGGTGALTMLLVSFPVNADVDPRFAGILRTSMVGFYLAMTAVGAWWLILFNRQAAKQYFAEGGAVTESARPLSIGAIGWYLVISAIGTAACGVFRVPTILFGYVVTGWTTLAVCTILTAIQLYLGAGLLQLDERARVWTIVFLCGIAGNGLAVAAAPGAAERLRTLAGEFSQKYFEMETPRFPNVWLIGITSVAVVAIPVWFLVRRRAAFAAVSKRER